MVETEPKLCPYHWLPCIKEKCMAWSGKQDLNEIEKDHKESLDALIQTIALQEMISFESAKEIVKMRNDDERCKLIRPEPVI